MEIGKRVVTTVDKLMTEGKEHFVIPKGSIGIICEIHPTFVFVELYGDFLPDDASGVYDFKLGEIEEID